MPQQFYKLTLEEVLSLHRLALIPTSTLLYLYCRIRFKADWKMTLHQREISEKLGISKHQFYRAVNKLKDKGLVKWETQNEIVFTLPGSNSNPNLLEKTTNSCDPRNRVAECVTQVAECATEVTGRATQVAGRATPTAANPAPAMAYSVSPDYYQIFIRSLSDREREEFFLFVQKQIKDFKQPIQDLEAWLAHNNSVGKPRWQVYHQNFLHQQTKKSVGSNRIKKFHDEIEQRRLAAIQTWKKEQEND